MFIRESSSDTFGDLKSLSAHVMGDSVLISYPDLSLATPTRHLGTRLPWFNAQTRLNWLDLVFYNLVYFES